MITVVVCELSAYMKRLTIEHTPPPIILIPTINTVNMFVDLNARVGGKVV